MMSSIDDPLLTSDSGMGKLLSIGVLYVENVRRVCTGFLSKLKAIGRIRQ
uniref:StAR-related lipid transfer protein 3 n=1 Tax=Parascaris univalens TaxID=6257 RepID=A0A915B372_PARUN